MSASSIISKPSPERAAEILESLADIRSRVQAVSSSSSSSGSKTLVAVSKYKDASDVLACYEGGQRDFGENYFQELAEKAPKLPRDIRWHFIGTLQSKKGKDLASIPNLYAVQTVTSIKAAKVLNAAIEEGRTLNVLLQVNTSGEESKSGVPPLTSSLPTNSELIELAQHIIAECDRLHLQGLMTIGSLAQSLSTSENEDFETLTKTRDTLQAFLDENRQMMQRRVDDRLKKEGGERMITWGEDGRLLLSMGMSSDFEAALKAGSDIVRVGTGIFGERPKKVGKD